jgi:hypothetical protein
MIGAGLQGEVQEESVGHYLLLCNRRQLTRPNRNSKMELTSDKPIGSGVGEIPEL